MAWSFRLQKGENTWETFACSSKRSKHRNPSSARSRYRKGIEQYIEKSVQE